MPFGVGMSYSILLDLPSLDMKVPNPTYVQDDILALEEISGSWRFVLSPLYWFKNTTLDLRTATTEPSFMRKPSTALLQVRENCI